jgi:DnaK suppressor protein
MAKAKSKTKPKAKAAKSVKAKAAPKKKTASRRVSHAAKPSRPVTKSKSAHKAKAPAAKAAPKSMLKPGSKPSPAPFAKTAESKGGDRTRADAMGAALAPAAKPQLRPTPVRRITPDEEERDTSAAIDFPAVGKREISKMPHIDDATLAKIVAKLREMRAESQAVISQQVQADLSAKEGPGEVGDDLDQAVTERNREFNLIMHQRHLRRIQQVDEALQRIAEGTYGFCEGTDEPINPRRLVIMPLARYSLEYQEQQEKTLGRSPDEAYAAGEESFAVEE